MIQDEVLGALVQAALMGGHHLAGVDHHQRPGPQADLHPPAGQAGGHRVEALPHTDTGLGVDHRTQHRRDVELVGRQGQQEGRLSGRGLPNRDRAGPDETVVIGGVTCSYQLVQLGERTHSGIAWTEVERAARARSLPRSGSPDPLAQV